MEHGNSRMKYGECDLLELVLLLLLAGLGLLLELLRLAEVLLLLSPPSMVGVEGVV